MHERQNWCSLTIFFISSPDSSHNFYGKTQTRRFISLQSSLQHIIIKQEYLNSRQLKSAEASASKMGVNNERIVNRRQLLVRAGSFMKMSWRKSKEELIDFDEDNDNENSSLRKGRRKTKPNLSVRFNDDLHVVPSDRKESISDEEKEMLWYQVSYFVLRRFVWRSSSPSNSLSLYFHPLTISFSLSRCANQ